jgi:SseB protein N-terminal domain/SseB protein C-terminal domain
MGWPRRRRSRDPGIDILDAELLVLADESEGTFDTLEDEDGNVYLVAFTSAESMRDSAEEGTTSMPLLGRNVLALLLETECAGVVVDPGGDQTLVIPRAAAEELAGPSQETLWAGPSVLVAEPDEPVPASLLERLRTVVAQDPTVNSAYFFLAAAPGREAYPQAVLGLDLASGAEISDTLLTAFQETHGPVAEFIETYPNMDVHVLDGGLLDLVREHGVLVYEREPG